MKTLSARSRPGGPADMDFVQLLVPEENRQPRTFGVSDLLVLTHLWHNRSMEQMILQVVRAHGRIARKYAAELCRLSVNQASYLLKTMADRGIIRLIGKGRTAHYTLAANTKSTRN